MLRLQPLISWLFFVIAQSASIDSGISESIEQFSKLVVANEVENSNYITEVAVNACVENGKKIVLDYGEQLFWFSGL